MFNLFYQQLMRKKSLFIYFIIILIALVIIYQFIKPQKISHKSKADETATLLFNPSSLSAQNNQDFTVTLKVRPSQSLTIQLYQIHVNFDRSKAKVKEINYITGQASTNLGADHDETINTINNGAGIGTIKLYGEILDANGKILNSETELVRLIFTSNVNDSYQITTSNSVLKKINGDYTISDVDLSQAILNVSESTPTNTPPPAATNTPPPAATNTPPPAATNTPPPAATNTPPPVADNLTLNLSLRFQGIVNQCPSDNKKIKAKFKLGGKASTEYKSADFSCQQGKWTGSLSFNAPAGSGYLVYVKGEKHLQKKICDQIPQESRLGPGTYNCRDGQITLNAGENNLDFTGILNLYGDLPVGGEQDGVINALDTSYIRNNLGKTDPDVLAICDGNLDGKCDTQDWSMLISSLSIKGDEL